MTQMNPPSMSQKMTPRAAVSCAKRFCAPRVPKESEDIMPSSPIVKRKYRVNTPRMVESMSDSAAASTATQVNVAAKARASVQSAKWLAKMPERGARLARRDE